jgi:hypothetical protein
MRILSEITKVITVLCLILLTFSATVWAVREFQNFSSSSFVPGAGVQGHHVLSELPDAPPRLMSCLELQRELNRRNPKLNLKIDGICGTRTQAAWDEATNTQTAMLLWPEDAK